MMIRTFNGASVIAWVRRRISVIGSSCINDPLMQMHPGYTESCLKVSDLARYEIHD
jgi:hypothetical protein